MMSDGRAIETTLPQPGPCKKRAPRNPAVETASFSYAGINKTNNVKFAYQSSCNPPITSLIKEINAGFLKGSLHLGQSSHLKGTYEATAQGDLKY
jgi:hypothetical protein